MGGPASLFRAVMGLEESSTLHNIAVGYRWHRGAKMHFSNGETEARSGKAVYLGYSPVTGFLWVGLDPKFTPTTWDRCPPPPPTVTHA